MSFRKMSTARMDEQVSILKCNPALDIVGIALKCGKVELYRFLNWKKFATLEPTRNLKLNSSDPAEKVIGFEWSPNGKYIAIIYDGTFLKDKQYYPNNIALASEETLLSTSHNSSLDDSNLDDKDEETRAFILQQRRLRKPTAIAVFDISTQQQILFRNCTHRVNNIVWIVNKKPEPSQNQGDDSNNNNEDSNNIPLPHDTIEIPYTDLYATEKDFFAFLGYEYSKLVPETQQKPNKFQTMFRKTERAVEMDLAKFERFIFFSNQSTNQSFNIQVQVSAGGTIDFYAFGLYKVLSLKLLDLLKECGLSNFNTKSLETDIELEDIWNSNINIHEVFLMLRNRRTKKRLILSFPLSVIDRCRQQLYAYTSLLFQIDLRTEFLDRSLQKMSEIWQDLSNTINRMLSDYLPKVKGHGSELEDHIDAIYSSTKKIKLAAGDFMEMLLSGHVSPHMEKFLSDMSETDFKKLALNLEMYFVRLSKFNSEEMQSKLYQLLCFANVFKAISLEKLRFVDLSLEPTEVNIFIRNVHAMLIKSTQMQTSICDSMKKLRSFIRWLSNCSITYAKDNDAETRVELGLDDDEYFLLNPVLTNSDLHLVMEFLKDNSLTSGFRFPEVEFYLRTTVPSMNDRSLSIDNDEKDIAYRTFVARRQREKIVEELHESLSQDSADQSVTMEITTDEVKGTDGELEDEKPKSFAMKFENIEEFEKDLYDGTDDVDKFDERNYAGMGLYAHLVQLYDNFTQMFVNQTCERLSQLQNELFREKIDQIAVCEVPGSFGTNSNVEQLYDDSQCCQFLASVCEARKQLFVLQKDNESQEFNSFSMEFHFNDEQQRRVQLWITDFKFFDSEILTVILSVDNTTDKEASKNDDNDDYEEEVKMNEIESGQFLLQIRFQSFIFASQTGDDFFNTSNDSNSNCSSQTVTLPKLDVCLDSKINRKWLTDAEDQVIEENVELRELGRGTVDYVVPSKARNIVTVVSNGRRRITFYDIADEEESEEVMA